MRIQQQPRSGYTLVRICRRRLSCWVMVGFELGSYFIFSFSVHSPSPLWRRYPRPRGGGLLLELVFYSGSNRLSLCLPTKLESFRRMRQVGTPVGEIRAPRAPHARHHFHAASGIDQQRFEAGDDQVGEFGRRTPGHQQESRGRRHQDDKVGAAVHLWGVFESVVAVASIST